MILMPEPATAVIDPFYQETTVDLRCDVVEPMAMRGCERDLRSLAKRAEAYLKASGIANEGSDALAHDDVGNLVWGWRQSAPDKGP